MAEDAEAVRASRDQVPWHVKGNQGSDQCRQKGRGENETEGREGRNKLSTWFMGKQKHGKREGGVIRSRRSGRRAAYWAGQLARKPGDGDAWVSLSGGQNRDKDE